LSRYWEVLVRSFNTPVASIRRSASVLLPWSMWAMMEKFRIFWIGNGIL